MKRHWYIDGGFGFIGSYLVKLLLMKNEKVTIYDDRGIPSGFSNHANFNLLAQPNGMLGSQKETAILVLSRSIIKNRTTAILSDEMKLEQKRISLAVKSLNPGSRVIYISSGGAIYGPSNDGKKHSELDPVNPATPYGKSKEILENYISEICAARSLSLITLRPGNPIGTGHLKGKTQNVADTFLLKILSGETLEVWGSVEIEKDFFDIRDLANAIYQLGIAQKVTGTYNVGSGNTTSLNELIEMMHLITKKMSEIKIINPVETDILKYEISIKKIVNDINWSTSYSLTDTISKMYSDFLK